MTAWNLQLKTVPDKKHANIFNLKNEARYLLRDNKQWCQQTAYNAAHPCLPVQLVRIFEYGHERDEKVIFLSLVTGWQISPKKGNSVESQLTRMRRVAPLQMILWRVSTASECFAAVVWGKLHSKWLWDTELTRNFASSVHQQTSFSSDFKP